MKFKEHIENILNYKFKKRDDYYEDESNKTIKITIDDKSQGNEITFDILSDISRLLGTRLINFSGLKQNFSYSEYTSDYTYGCEITCEGVNFDVEFE